ncbi:hypothetical protein B6A14_09285 [Polynucleobacter hirudinilacicola]|uniref:HD-GYP domain-containing protein n=1 Tax=Polynucleobacter hirudinilacicola TaxID=1743166 RepID=A0A210RY65_9BURK|nr:HD domain-containing phosphohydrolase [Polynucleobacter hirudinilacicola]OWF65939.1 hypothetical protein B6A14_09285 [Polynucleobacter hirudinilacicola]
MRKKYIPIHRLNAVLIVTICAGEALIMLILPSLGTLSNIATVFVDIALLSLITIPVVRWTVTRPMTKYLHDLESAKRKITVREDQMLSALNSLAEAKDNETGSHILRTQQYVKLLAYRLQSMGYCPETLSDEHIEKLVKVAPLHDLGKVGIPDHILKKTGRLTDEEKSLIYSHALIGENILAAAQSEDLEVDLISTAMRVAGAHHEKWDGSGYPRKLHGDNIPIEARIMSVADVFDALVSTRPYKKAWSIEEAYAEIISKSGSDFDPVVVEAFIAERQNFEHITKRVTTKHPPYSLSIE